MYKIMYNRGVGYALFTYNYEACMWQQLTKWYRYLGNLQRFANIYNLSISKGVELWQE